MLIERHARVRFASGMIITITVICMAACASRPAPTPETAYVAPLTIPPIADAGAVDTRDDERVGSTRVVEREVEPRRAGDAVEVEWNGTWYPAVLLAPRGSEWLIHYEGYDESWDEVVPEGRIRDPRPLPGR